MYRKGAEGTAEAGGGTEETYKLKTACSPFLANDFEEKAAICLLGSIGKGMLN